MKFRGKKRNLQEISVPDKVRGLTKTQIEEVLPKCNYLGQVLNELKIKSTYNLRLLLFEKLQELIETATVKLKEASEMAGTLDAKVQVADGCIRLATLIIQKDATEMQLKLMGN